MTKELYLGYNRYTQEVFLNIRGNKNAAEDIGFRRLFDGTNFINPLMDYLVKDHGTRKKTLLKIEIPEPAASELEEKVSDATVAKQLNKWRVNKLPYSDS